MFEIIGTFLIDSPQVKSWIGVFKSLFCASNFAGLKKRTKDNKPQYQHWFKQEKELERCRSKQQLQEGQSQSQAQGQDQDEAEKNESSQLSQQSGSPAHEEAMSPLTRNHSENSGVNGDGHSATDNSSHNGLASAVTPNTQAVVPSLPVLPSLAAWPTSQQLQVAAVQPSGLPVFPPMHGQFYY